MSSSSCARPVTSAGKGRRIRTAVRLVGAGFGLAVAAYAALAASTWYRYGSPQPAGAEDVDPLLDRFMSTYDVVERHHVRVLAPAEITLAAAREQDLLASPVTRAIFKTRELAFGSTPDKEPGNERCCRRFFRSDGACLLKSLLEKSSWAPRPSPGCPIPPSARLARSTSRRSTSRIM